MKPSLRDGLCQAARLLVAAWFLASASFLAVVHLPGDASMAASGPEVSRAARAQFRQSLGADRSPASQYVDYLHLLAVQGDLGYSRTLQRPVVESLQAAFPFTLALTLLAVTLSVPAGLTFGLAAGLTRRRSFQHAHAGLAALLHATPAFGLALCFAPLQPIEGQWVHCTHLFSSWHGTLLPALTLAIPLAGHLTQMTRNITLRCIASPFVTTALATGQGPLEILFKQVMPHLLPNTMRQSALSIATLLGGVIAIELIFSRPGLGRLIQQGVLARDPPLVAGVTLAASSLAFAASQSLRALANHLPGP